MDRYGYVSIWVEKDDREAFYSICKQLKRKKKDMFKQMVHYFLEHEIDPQDAQVRAEKELAKLRNTLVSFIRRQEKDILAPMSNKVDAIAVMLSKGDVQRRAYPISDGPGTTAVPTTDVAPTVDEMPKVTDSKKEKESVTATDGEGEKDWKAEYEKVVKERDEIRADLYEVLSDIAYTTTSSSRRRWVHTKADIESMRRMRIKMGMPLPPEH